MKPTLHEQFHYYLYLINGFVTSVIPFYLVIKLARLFHFFHLDFIGNWLGEVTGINSRLKEIIRLSDLERLTGDKHI